MELKNTEKQEHSVVALTIEITKAEFEAAKDKAFKKTGKNITVPGFRKGKAPRKMIEKLYGEGVFFEEAFNIIYPDAMEMAVEKSSSRSAVQTLTWATRQKRAADHHRQGTG
ncbi:MAG: trigger factor family protein [Butyricicoccaceae bacterium]